MYNQLILWLIFMLGTINLCRMTLFMIGSDFYGLRMTIRKKRHVVRTDLPTFSVVIPAYNEEKNIVESVKSVTEADYPQEKLQIIVVDDGSTDTTISLLREFQKLHTENNLVVVSQKNAGKAHAMNNAIKNHATGELVMCLDADSTIAPQALKKAVAHFQDPRVVAMSSNVKIRDTGTLFNLIQMYEYLVSYQMKRALTLYNIEYIIGGIGSTFRRVDLDRVGYYDTDTITEDIDLTMKFLREGNKANRVVYASDVITYTESVLDVRGLIRQRYRWKYGRCQTFYKNSALFFSRDPDHGKLLSWFYLPFAVFSDLAFFFEPFMVSYILYIVLYYHDWITLLSAIVAIGLYLSINVLAEDTIPWKQKIKMTLIAPSMYFFFYILSFVEYVALLKSYARIHRIRKSIGGDSCSWQPVERPVRIS